MRTLAGANVQGNHKSQDIICNGIFIAHPVFVCIAGPLTVWLQPSAAFLFFIWLFLSFISGSLISLEWQHVLDAVTVE